MVIRLFEMVTLETFETWSLFCPKLRHADKLSKTPREEPIDLCAYVPPCLNNYGSAISGLKLRIFIEIDFSYLASCRGEKRFFIMAGEPATRQ